MLSRVADSILWMNRYIERAENVARFIEVNQKLSLGFQQGIATQWTPLIKTTGDEKAFEEKYDDYTQENVVRFLMFDQNNPNSIASCLNYARENARCVRDNLSLAIWEAINKFYLIVRDSPRDNSLLRNPHRLLDKVKHQSQVVSGATDTTLSHGDGWNVAQLGRFLERADKTSRILDVKYYMLLPKPEDVDSELDIVQWTALLNSTSALQMYRRRYGRIQREKVVEFLVLSRLFPRSISFCMNNADAALRTLTGTGPGNYCNSAEQLLGRMCTTINYTSLDDVLTEGLHEFIDKLQLQLNDLGTEIQNVFYGVTSESQSQQQSQLSF